jgi:hypothetical protein
MRHVVHSPAALAARLSTGGDIRKGPDGGVQLLCQKNMSQVGGSRKRATTTTVSWAGCSKPALDPPHARGDVGIAIMMYLGRRASESHIDGCIVDLDGMTRFIHKRYASRFVLRYFKVIPTSVEW